MIKLCRAPTHDRMADGTVCSEIAGDMIGIIGRFKVGLVAGIAIRAGLAVKRAGLMAGAAVADIMPSHKWKVGRMLEGR